jgi:hypothetical protein
MQMAQTNSAQSLPESFNASANTNFETLSDNIKLSTEKPTKKMQDKGPSTLKRLSEAPLLSPPN